MIRGLLVFIGLAVVVLVVLMAFGVVSLEQTRTASLPTVRVEGGQAPKFKADVGEVQLGTSQKRVEVPEVNMTNKTVAVPTVDVEKADQQ